MKQSFQSHRPDPTTSGTAPKPGRPTPDRPHRPAIPGYLFRSYWWAYLWPPAVWFFDHQPVINTILFGQYRRLLRGCVNILSPAAAGRTLQIAAVYGVLTPTLARHLRSGALHVLDVAPIQLDVLRRKLAGSDRRVRLCRANAESLPYRDGGFDTVLLFFLLHELPPAVRRTVLREALRVLPPGGHLVIADYGELRGRHPLHRIRPLRRLLERLEPFLRDFWREDLAGELHGCAEAGGRAITAETGVEVFGGFYRVQRYRVD